MNSKTFIKANSLKELCDQIVPKYSKQTRESQSEINTKNNQKKLDQDIKPQIHNSRTTQICIDSDSDYEWPELFILKGICGEFEEKNFGTSLSENIHHTSYN